MKSVERWLILLSVAVASASAQFTVEGRPVQVHGFASQGLVYSDANNYLTMDTGKGALLSVTPGLMRPLRFPISSVLNSTCAT